MTIVRFKLLFLLGLAVAYCYGTSAHTTLPSPVRIIEEIPNFDGHFLVPKHQKLVNQLKSFASEYTRKAHKISRLQGNKKLRAGKLLEGEMMRRYRGIEPKIHELQEAPKLRLSSNFARQRSIMEELQSFTLAVMQLPVKIHCLIFGCKVTAPYTTTVPTTLPEGDEDE